MLITRRACLATLAAIPWAVAPLGASCDAEFGAAMKRQWAGAFDDDKAIDDSTPEPLPLYAGDPGDGVSDVRSCLAAIGYFVGSRTVAGQLTTPTTGFEIRPGVLPPDARGQSRYFPADWFLGRSMDILLAGQFKHDAGKAALTRCHDSFSNKEDFWREVLVAAGGSADFAAARVGLRWQHQNNPGSIQRTLSAWGPIASAPGTFKQIQAMYLLMLGQRHQDGRAAVAIYRACYAADKSQFIALVANP